MKRETLELKRLTFEWCRDLAELSPRNYLFRNFTLLVPSKIIIVSLASPAATTVRSLTLEVIFKHFIVCLQVVRSVDRFEEILFDALFFFFIISVLSPYRDGISLKSSPDLNATNVILSLKLIPNDCQKQIFPKSIRISFLNPDVPSSSLLTSVVLP